MDDFGLFGLLAWLLAWATFGTWVVWKPGLWPKLVGGAAVLIGLAPSMVVLWMLAVS